MRTIHLLANPNPTAALDLGDGMRITEDSAGMHYFEHDCVEIENFDGELLRKRIGPNLSPHTRTGLIDRITVRPSILCPDCGLHGFVTDGVWRGC
jgi:hypothetical protein